MGITGIGQGSSTRLLEGVTAAPATSEVVRPIAKDRTFQATLEGGTSCTVVIEVCNDRPEEENWIILSTFTLTGDETDGSSSDAPWQYVRARVSAQMGGVLSVYMGL